MELLLSRSKKTFMRVVALFLFYTGTLKLLSRLVNRFQCKNNEQGKPAFPFVARRRYRNVQILAYHRVNDEKDPFFPAIGTNQFAQHMKVLAECFTVCSLQRLLEGMRSGDIPENAVAVTLDDGYRDNYLHAFPILKRYSISATIFLASGVIGTGGVLWHDRVFAAFSNTHAPFLDGREFHMENLSLLSLQEKLEAQARLLKYLWMKDEHERELAIHRLRQGLAVTEAKEVAGPMLSWEEVLEMRGCGIEFGAHTVTHPILSTLTEERARQEIADSKRVIEEHLGVPVRNFAYPVGRSKDFNSTTKSIVKEAGFSGAVTMIFGSNDSESDVFELRRMIPWDKDADTFRLRLNYQKFRS